jgi:hypothetical protein
MQSALNIARLAGPALAVIGIGLLTNQDAYREMAAQFVGAYPYIYISGILMLLGGLTILNAHNAWTGDWRTLITLIGWIMAVIGTFRLIAPPFVGFVGAGLFGMQGFFIGAGAIFLALGGFLTFKGYVAEPAASETEQ